MTDHKADANVVAVQRKLGERSAVGVRKYGTTTERGDLTRLDWLRHLQEELMDAAVYIEALAAAPAASEGEDGAVAWRIYWSCAAPGYYELTGSQSRVADVRTLEAPPPIEPLYTRPAAQVAVTPKHDEGRCKWDDGSPCVEPRPVGMVYPPKPAPRASGYLSDDVEWNAYDTAQMEAYARAAYSDGYNAALATQPAARESFAQPAEGVSGG